MESSEPENLFRRRAIAALTHRSPGRPICVAPRPWAWLTGLLLLLFAAAAVFAASADYARKESVRGWLVSTTGVARIASRRTATVAEVRVRPGDVVRTGDVLVVLTSDTALVDGSGLSARTLRELESSLQEVDAQIALLTHRQQLQQDGLETQLELLQQQSDALGTGQLQVQERVATHEDRLRRMEPLLVEGDISDWDVLGQRDELSRLRQEHERLRGQQLQIRQQMTELGQQRSDAVIALELRQSELREHRSRLLREISSESLRERSMLLAPVDGVVATVEAGAGTAIREGQLLMAIVPADAVLAADVYVPSRAIGFVEAGGIASLAYDAFPKRQFGLFAGRVEHVSEYVSLPGDIPQTFRLQEACYKVRIAIEADKVATSRGAVGLRPGMLLSAEILLERRSLADWFLEPLRLRRATPG